MKFICILLFMILCSQLVFASEFKNDTSVKNGDIVYTFKKGINVDFSFIGQGIILDDTEKMSFSIQGGELEIIFYNISDNSKILGFKSNVPQTITFSIASNGQKQYIFDGKDYYSSTIDVGTEELHWTYLTFKEKQTIEKEVSLSSNEKKKYWFNNNIFFVEIPEIQLSESKTIGSTIFHLTYLSLFFILISVGLVILIWNKFQQKQ